MKRISIFFSMMLVSLCTFAQTQNIIKCHTTEYMEELRRQNPGMQTDAGFERDMAALLRQRAANPTTNARVGPYIIPVIVHVLHTGQPVGTRPNIPAAQVQSQIRVINEDFNRTNANATNYWGTRGAGIPGGIQFKLATVDPNGIPLLEPGVDRQVIAAQPGYDRAYTETVIKPATSWDPTRYLNLWTISNPTTSSPGTLLGYAQFPTFPSPGPSLPGLGFAGAGNTDGIVINVLYFGTNYTSTGAGAGTGFNIGASVKGRTLTHELGHFFGLRHIWGDGTCADDFCADTPTHEGPNQNLPCYTHPKANTCGTGTPDEMFENYMDYTGDDCMSIFTQDQVGRMDIAISSGTRRSTLLTSTAANSLGAIANFSASATSGCAPFSVNFTDNSIVSTGGAITSWVWNFDNTNIGGAFPSTFTGQNPPSVIFSGNGDYTVRLTTTNSIGSTSRSVIITSSGTLLLSSPPIVQDFETITTFSGVAPLSYRAISTGSDNWQPSTITGQASAKSAAIGVNGLNGQTLRLNTPGINLGAGLGASLQFWVAYSKQTAAPSTDFATLSVEYSEDCGVTYNSVPLFTKSNTALETAPSIAAFGGFTPTASQWRQETVDISSLIGKGNVRFSFKVVGSSVNTGVFMFIDNITLSTTGVTPISPSPLSAIIAVSPAVGVSVSWVDRSSDEVSFDLQRAVGAGAFGSIATPVATAGASTISNFNDVSAAATTEGNVNSYRIRAVGNVNNSPFSNTVVLTIPIKTPTLLSGILSGSTVSLSWTDNSSVETGYKVERSTSPTSAFVVIATLPTANVNSYVDNSLAPCTQYFYRVYAYLGSVNSANSNTTPGFGNGQPAPVGLSATASATAIAINLAWTANPTGCSDGYNIERSTNATTGFAQIGTSTSTTYMDITASPSTQYFYRISGYRAAVLSPLSGVVSATVIDFNAPTALTAVGSVAKVITLTWADNTGVEQSYRIERKAGAAGTFAEIASVGANVLTYVDAGLGTIANGTECFYRVRGASGTFFTTYSNNASAVANDAVASVNDKLNSQVSISPNPANTNFEINFNALTLKAEKIELVNAMGQVVTNKTFDQKVIFEVSNLPKGLYYVKVNSNKGAIVKKIVIN